MKPRPILGYGLPEATLAALAEAVPSSFERVTERRWVSRPHHAIRQIVEFAAFKGAQYGAQWGFSVDFVPKCGARGLSWKRTAHTATLDLVINPAATAERPLGWSYIANVDSTRHAARVARKAWISAGHDFARVRSLPDLRDTFAERSAIEPRGSLISMYTQADLAWGLLDIACGDDDSGRRRIQRFCQRNDVPDDDRRLVQAIVTATEIALRSEPHPRGTRVAPPRS